jgi:hypothetical protein
MAVNAVLDKAPEVGEVAAQQGCVAKDNLPLRKREPGL